MPNRIWVFKSVPHRKDTSHTNTWKWQATAPDGKVTESPSNFNTLNHCVRDAQAHGFQGIVDPADGSVTAAGVYTIKIAIDGAVEFVPTSSP